MKRNNLSGQKFSKLTVIEYSYTQKPKGIAFWKCQCDCGKIIEVSTSHLISDHTRSCGCLQSETATKNSIGNTWGRKYQDPMMVTAKHIWTISYIDGCSFDKFLELSQQNCHYCNIEPFTTFNKYITKEGILTNKQVTMEWAQLAYFTYNGLDRVDSTLKHTEDNIVPCCIICNISKHNMTEEQFKNWIIKIYNHYINKKSQVSPAL